jgi:thioesterase domain-containing protein
MSNTKREMPTDVLVRLRATGDGWPLYLVHPTHGNGLCYGPLSAFLESRHPVYGVLSAGLVPGLEPDQTIEQMGRRYVERIVSENPDGPYLLGGWSQGAHIALEMSNLLQAMGKDVAHVFSIDNMFIATDASPITGEKIDFDFLLLNLLFQQVTDNVVLQNFKALDLEQKFDYLLDVAAERKLYPPSIDKDTAARMVRVFYFNCLASWQYDKIQLEERLRGVPVTYFFATEDAPFERERQAFRMLRDGFKEKRAKQSPAFMIQGSTHFNLLSVPHVKELAESMAVALGRVQPHTEHAA